MSPIPAASNLAASGSPFPEQNRLNLLEPPEMPSRKIDDIFAPPVSPYLIDLDRELAQFSSYISSQKSKLLSGGPGLRPNGQRKTSSDDDMDRLVNLCDQLMAKVNFLRKEGHPDRKK